MTEQHTLGEPFQVAYPGGKDGFWRTTCSCGYLTDMRDRVSDAQKDAAQHKAAKEAAAVTEPQTEPSVYQQEAQWHEDALRKHLNEIAGRLRRIAEDIEDQNVSRSGGSVASDVLEMITWGVANTKVGRLAYLGAQLDAARAQVAMEAKA